MGGSIKIFGVLYSLGNITSIARLVSLGNITYISRLGNITSIALQKNTFVTGTLDATNLTANNLTTSATGINIGTTLANQTINIGNATSKLTYNGNHLMNYNKSYFTAFSHSGLVATTVWTVLCSGAQLFQTTLLTRNDPYAYVKITVNIPLSNWGVSGGVGNSYVINNRHISIARSTTAFTPLQTITSDIVPPSPGITTGSTYGLHHILANTNQYDTCCFTYIDHTPVTVNTIYYYAVVARVNSAGYYPLSIGNGSYVDISVEELI